MFLGLRSAITDVVLAQLEEGLWLTGFEPIIRMDRDDAKLIQWIIENGYIPESAIMNAVHDGICACGRRSFAQHTKFNTPPDHTMSPKALGYAIRYGVITKEEMAQIKFDHGETAEEYVKNADGLLDRMMEEFSKGPSQRETPHSYLISEDEVR